MKVLVNILASFLYMLGRDAKGIACVDGKHFVGTK
jgi:hypothetical protein